MKAVVYTAHAADRDAFERARGASAGRCALDYVSVPLDLAHVDLAAGSDAVVPFVNDRLDAPVLDALAARGVRLVALRSAGHDNVDLAAAARAGLSVVYVPGYTPHSVAEYVFALALALLRHVPRACARARAGDFDIEGLVGSLLAGRRFGVVGLGRIGRVVAGIAEGFGCEVVGSYPQSAERRWPLLPLDELLASSHVVSLHAPLIESTRGLIDARRLALMRSDAILVNTSRGALVDTGALVDALKHGRLGGAALDVYEHEAGLFYADHSAEILQDDVLARLLTFPNVVLTSHLGFMSREALDDIARTTLASLDEFAQGRPLSNALAAPAPGVHA